MVTFLKTLTDEQVEILLRNMEKDDEEYKSEKIDPPESEIREKNASEMEKNLSRILGSISERQKILIQDWSLHQKLIGEDEFAERMSWRALFKNTLNLRNNEKSFENSFDYLLEYNDTVRPASYQEKLDYNEELMRSTLILIDYTMTDEQREFLINKMTDIADQLEELIDE